MNDWPPHLREDVLFGHDAAFRAAWAIDEMLRRLSWAADHRRRLSEDVLCSCQGPFVDHLKDEVRLSGEEAAGLAERLRLLRSRISDAREQALVDEIRLEVARSEWLAAQRRAAKLLALVQSAA
jgi:hypothetical protein